MWGWSYRALFVGKHRTEWKGVQRVHLIGRWDDLEPILTLEEMSKLNEDGEECYGDAGEGVNAGRVGSRYQNQFIQNSSFFEFSARILRTKLPIINCNGSDTHILPLASICFTSPSLAFHE